MSTYSNVFSNDKITVSYEPKCCVNSALCAKQLSEVFRQSVIPWINLEGAKTKRIIKQIQKCPSGALKYQLNSIKAQKSA